ncbi:unnamed protein product [Amoebophrya sp. A120]|nr:unnamed protein product [Amoebophrya sp. A120]|eukprot:GSA120T00015473001.1
MFWDGQSDDRPLLCPSFSLSRKGPTARSCGRPHSLLLLYRKSPRKGPGKLFTHGLCLARMLMLVVVFGDRRACD